jgi:HK97 family phage major capsid protein
MSNNVLDDLAIARAVKQTESESATLRSYSRSDKDGLAACRKNSELYSLQKLLRDENAAGLELEISQEIERSTRQPAQGVYVPIDALLRNATRDLAATSATAGQTLVSQNMVSRNLAEFLRPTSVCLNAGANLITGIKGNTNFVRQTSTTNPVWEGTENALLSPNASENFEIVSVFPKRASTAVTISRSLLKQSALNIESLVSNDLLSAIAQTLDISALVGNSGSNQPTGLFSMSQIPVAGSYGWINGFTYTSGAPTWTQVITAENLVDAQNVLQNASGAYIVSIYDKLQLKKTAKNSTNSSSFIWESDNTQRDGSGIVNGYKAFATTALNPGQVAFGKFSDLNLCMFGNSVDVVVDYYTGARYNVVYITATILCDVFVKHGPSFAISHT